MDCMWCLLKFGWEFVGLVVWDNWPPLGSIALSLSKQLVAVVWTKVWAGVRGPVDFWKKFPSPLELQKPCDHVELPIREFHFVDLLILSFPFTTQKDVTVLCILPVLTCPLLRSLIHFASGMFACQILTVSHLTGHAVINALCLTDHWLFQWMHRYNYSVMPLPPLDLLVSCSFVYLSCYELTTFRSHCQMQS